MARLSKLSKLFEFETILKVNTEVMEEVKYSNWDRQTSMTINCIKRFTF